MKSTGQILKMAQVILCFSFCKEKITFNDNLE